MPLSTVDDDEEIWVGARVRLYNVGMNREDKENNFYEYIISYIYDNTNYLQLTNLTTGKAGYIICVIEKNYQIIMLCRTLKQRIGLENTYFRFE